MFKVTKTNSNKLIRRSANEKIEIVIYSNEEEPHTQFSKSKYMKKINIIFFVHCINLTIFSS